MKKLSFILATIFVLGVSNLMAQDNNDNEKYSHQIAITIPTLAILDVENSDGEAQSIDLKLDVENAEAGAEVDFAASTNSDLFLNYTSIVEPHKKNKITVQVNRTAAQVANDGFHLTLKVGANNGGEGTLGQTPSNNGMIEFKDNTAQDLITGIRSCYSGDGSGKGNQLTYSLAADNYLKIDAEELDFKVTYTITADN